MNLKTLLILLAGLIFITIVLMLARPADAITGRHQEVCICHNVDHNPHTVCADRSSILEGHGKHLRDGKDEWGRCTEPTPTPTPTPKKCTPTPTPEWCPTEEPCPEQCHVEPVWKDDGQCGRKECVFKVPEAQSCPTECGYEGGVVPDGKCGEVKCESTKPCDGPTPTPTEEPTPTPTPGPGEPDPNDCHAEARCAGPASAPVCTDTTPVGGVDNPHVYRNGPDAVVKWLPDTNKAPKVHIWYTNPQTGFMTAVRDTDNDGEEAIHLLGSLDWNFAIQTANGCAAGEIQWIEDGDTDNWVLFRP